MLSFLTKTMTGQRYLKQDDANIWGYQDIDGSFKCHIQTPTPEEIQMYDGKIGKIFDVWTTIDSPFSLSDKVTIEGISYKVRGMKTLDHGSFPHKKYVVVSEDEK